MPDYPTEEELKKIRQWDTLYEDSKGLIEFVMSKWSYPNYCWIDEKDPDKYLFWTGGWSGNAQLISALQDNFIFWFCHWVSSRRGGHYEFEIKKSEINE